MKLPIEDIIKRYDSGESLGEIAKALGTYKNAIYRIVKKYGKIRDKSEAQSLVLAQNKKEHPTKGKHRTEEERRKISQGKYEAWQEYSDQELADLSKKGKDSWEKLSKDEQNARLTAAQEGSRRASREGSKIEIYVQNLLNINGFKTLWHTKVLQTDLEVDLFLPALNIAVEVNGPSHYENIWGDDKLKAQKKADHEKYATLTAFGVKVIRIKYLVSKLTFQVKEKLEKELIAIINEAKANKTKYLYDLEII